MIYVVGASLNFNVIGGTSQPTSASENTIWVNTDTAISGWVFSATEPTNPVAGMVWIKTALSAANEFNALKKNNITVYPISAAQYIGGTWVNKEAKRRNGSTWQSLARLPAEYQEVEYLQATGAQYIKTGIKNNSNNRVHLKCRIDTQENIRLYGTSGAPTSYPNCFSGQYNPEGHFTFKIGTAEIKVTKPIGNNYEIDHNGNTVTINGEVHTIGTQTVSNSWEMYLFGMYYDHSGSNYLLANGNRIFYWAKFYENGVLARDFVPCYRVADSVAGMYDLENGVFYTNAGSNSFICGGDV